MCSAPPPPRAMRRRPVSGRSSCPWPARCCWPGCEWAVSTISLVTVGGVLGVSSLGMLFADGFRRGIVAEILTGVVLTVALALFIDGLLVLAGRMLMPWTVGKEVRAA